MLRAPTRIAGLAKGTLPPRLGQRSRNVVRKPTALLTSSHVPTPVAPSPRGSSTSMAVSGTKGRRVGMGAGRLGMRKRTVATPRCIARPCQTLSDAGQKLTMGMAAPKKILADLAERLGVSSGEWKTFLPMTFLFFTMAFVNTIVSNLSQSLLITAPGGGAGVIPFLTVYAAFPLTLGATFLYAYASHSISHKKLFTITVGLFAASNLVFALCLFPNHEALHLPGIASTLTQFLPSGLQGAVGMVRNWTFSIFYCLAEMWGDMGISLLFWGFANDITTSKQAPILYPLMGVGANIAQTLGGIVLKLFSAGSAAAYGSRTQALLFHVVGCMFAVMLVHHFIADRTEAKKKQADHIPSSEQTHARQPRRKMTDEFVNSGGRVLPPLGVRAREQIVGVCRSYLLPLPLNRRVSSQDVLSGQGKMLQATFRGLSVRQLDHLPLIHVPVPEKKRPVAKKKKPTFMASLKTIASSPVVKSLGIMTIAQALSVTLMEFLWKSHLKLAYPTAAAFSGFMGDVATAVGLLTGTMMFLSPVLFSKVGWNGVAKITPVLMTIGGSLFFVACSAFHILGRIGGMQHLAQKALPVIVMGGAFLFVLSRGTKFSLFKPSEEMVYIKMDESQRTKGKAAVDVVGANLGKSGGSMLQQILLVLSGGHLLFITPVMFAVYMSMMKGWNGAVATLSGFVDQPEEAPDLERDEVGDMMPLTEDVLHWEDDRSVGSSVVEFNAHPDDNGSVSTERELSSHPMAL